MCSGGVDCTLLLQHSAATPACGGNSSWSIFAKCEPTIIIIIKCRASTMCKIELESAQISAHSSPKSLYINPLALASLPGSGDSAMTFYLKVPGLIPAMAYYCLIKSRASTTCKIELDRCTLLTKVLLRKFFDQHYL